MTVRLLKWVSGKDLYEIQRQVKKKRGEFAGFDVYFDVEEIVIRSMPNEAHPFWDHHKKWDKFEKYYNVKVTYEPKACSNHTQGV